MSFAAILFDLDGTLTDSISLIVHCYQQTMQRFCIAPEKCAYLGDSVHDLHGPESLALG
jgi:phosphoglycolate phosphatase-like HAD superfamily hydrolase